jgi:Skp family chaperone for outer membrane proteins
MNKSVCAAVLAAGLLLTACKSASSPATPANNSGAKPAKANPVVVVLDMNRLMGDSKLSKSLHEELKNWAESKQSELKARAAAVQQAEAAKEKPAVIEAMKRDLFQMQEMAKQEFQQRQEEAADRMKKTFDPLVQTLAKENGWDVILNRTAEGTIYTGEALDQTDYVLAKLNAASAPTAETAHPAEPGHSTSTP